MGDMKDKMKRAKNKATDDVKESMGKKDSSTER